MIKILLTGASGYIGKHFLNKLLESERYSISILIRPTTDSEFVSSYNNKVNIYEYDTFESLIKIFRIESLDLIIHLAGHVGSGITLEEVEKNINGNLVLTAHLLEAMRLNGVSKIINTGSYWEFDENGDNKPNTPYSIFKSASRNLIEYYAALYDFQYLNLVLYDVYGENDHRGKLLTKILSLKETETLELTGGEQEISFTYIGDVVSGYISAINLMINDENYLNQTFHLRNEESYKLKTVIEKLLTISGKIANVKYGNIPYSAYQLMSIPDNVSILPNWKTEVNLEEGFSRLVKQGL